MNSVLRGALCIVLAASALWFSSANGQASDSCWTHNGSLMRLVATGPARAFYYEKPRASLRAAGVRPGTLLFDGTNDNGYYSGTARVFSRHCPGAPLSYSVEGYVSNGERRVTLRGDRQVYDKCAATGRFRSDVLVFDYSHQC